MKLVVLILIGIAAIFLGLCSVFVWLPDVWSHRTIVVSRLKVGDREFVELTQEWAGDGYMTSVRHTIASEEMLTAVGDGDAAKAWRARMELNTNNATVRIRFNKKEWLYHYESKSLTIDGHSRLAE